MVRSGCGCCQPDSIRGLVRNRSPAHIVLSRLHGSTAAANDCARALDRAVRLRTRQLGRPNFNSHPQAFAYALSLTVIALALCWFGSESSPSWLEWIRARSESIVVRVRPRVRASAERQTANPASVPHAPPRGLALVVVLGIYGVLVFVHQLSPYVVALQLSVPDCLRAPTAKMVGARSLGNSGRLPSPTDSRTSIRPTES